MKHNIKTITDISLNNDLLLITDTTLVLFHLRNKSKKAPLILHMIYLEYEDVDNFIKDCEKEGILTKKLKFSHKWMAKYVSHKTLDKYRFIELKLKDIEIQIFILHLGIAQHKDNFYTQTYNYHNLKFYEDKLICINKKDVENLNIVVIEDITFTVTPKPIKGVQIENKTKKKNENNKRIKVK